MASSLFSDFNPRSDERSDGDLVEVIPSDEISIHAPTNGATQAVGLIAIQNRISIHAPTNGATITHCDELLFYIISIHAPTNGAT